MYSSKSVIYLHLFLTIIPQNITLCGITSSTYHTYSINASSVLEITAYFQLLPKLPYTGAYLPIIYCKFAEPRQILLCNV